MNARIRGIYTTALTRLLLEAGHEVVDASAPIRRRFDATFPTASPDIRVSTTTDRQGVGAHGDPNAIQHIRSLLMEVGRDTFGWTDPTSPGTVLNGEVTETLGGGAVMRLRVGESGDPVTTEGYLPYGCIDDRVETGDLVRVQVRTSAAPWTDRRPKLDGSLRIAGDLVALEPGSGTRVDVRDDEAARELSGMLDLLGLEPPDGWRAVWKPPAVDAETDELEAGLQHAVETVEELDSVVDAAGGVGILDDPGQRDNQPIATPNSGVWVWFGRESRFALDELRREVTTTIPGHHRVKTGAADASAGVDLAEALCDPDPDTPFPFDVVTAAFGPAEGDTIRLDHGKPDGRRITLGKATVTAVEPDGSVTVEREMTGGGTYDGLDVPREAGDIAETTLKEGRWWYPTTYRGRDGTVRGTYVNVCTPVEVFPDAARYVDLHVDVLKHRDGTIKRVDDNELRESVAAGDTPEPVAEKARKVAAALENAL